VAATASRRCHRIPVPHRAWPTGQRKRRTSLSCSASRARRASGPRSGPHARSRRAGPASSRSAAAATDRRGALAAAVADGAIAARSVR